MKKKTWLNERLHASAAGAAQLLVFVCATKRGAHCSLTGVSTINELGKFHLFSFTKEALRRNDEPPRLADIPIA